MVDTATMQKNERVLGLIAGDGVLPLLIARGARAAGHRVCCVGLRGQFAPELPEYCDAFATAGMARMSRWIRLLQRWGADEAVMAGGVRKAAMHDPLRLLRNIPDLRSLRLWYRRLRHDRRNATVLAAVADELHRAGVTLIDSTTFIPDHLASGGVLGSVQPAASQRADIDFAWPLVQGSSELHIGQALAVKEGDVIAVEAVEGTAAMIRRAGDLCPSGGWTLLKTSPSDQDRRTDVPSIGVDTIDQMKAAGGSCVAVGSGRVILLDRPAVLAAADAQGIAVVGVEA